MEVSAHLILLSLGLELSLLDGFLHLLIILLQKCIKAQGILLQHLLRLLQSLLTLPGITHSCRLAVLHGGRHCSADVTAGAASGVHSRQSQACAAMATARLHAQADLMPSCKILRKVQLVILRKPELEVGETA